MIELGARNSCEPEDKRNVSEQFWRVCGASISRGLRTSLRLTGKTHLVAHPHGGRVLMLQYMENHLLKCPFQKIPMSPQETRERRRLYLFGFNSGEYFTVHLMSSPSVFDWLCCQFGRSFSNHSLASSGLSGYSMTDALRSRAKIGDRRKRPCSADVVLVQQPFSSNPGPSNGGVRTCIAVVRVLKTATFEGSGFLGNAHFTCGRSVGWAISFSR